MVIYKGKKAVCGFQLVHDRIWRYVMSEDENLVVEIKNAEGTLLLSKAFTSEDVDEIDKQVNVLFTPEETELLPVGFAQISASLDDILVVKPQPIVIKEVVI